MPSAAYAIDLALRLDTTVAEEKLDGVLTQIDNIYKSLVSLASFKIDVNASNLAQQLESIQASAQGYADSSLETVGTLSTNVSKLEKTNDLQTTMEELLEGSKDHILEIEDHLEQFYKKKFPTINKQSKEFKDSTGLTSKIWSNIKRDINGLVNDFTDAVAGLFGLRAAMRQLFEEETALLELNYRYYGSVAEVMSVTRELTTEYGLLRSNAIAAYAAVAQTRAPREEIKKLAAEVGLMAEASGLSVKAISDFQVKTRILGGGADAFARQMNWMSNAMVNFGLTGDQIGSILGAVGDKSVDFALTLGQTGAENVMKLTAAWQGMGNAMGASDDAAAKIMTTLHDVTEAGYAARVMMLGTGDIITDQDELVRRLADSTTVWGDAIKDVRLGQDGAIIGEDTIPAEELMKLHALAAEMQVPFSDLLKMTLAARDAQAQTADDFIKKTEEMAQSERYASESTRQALEEKRRQQAVLADYNVLLAQMQVAWMELFVAVSPILIDLINLIRMFVPVLTAVTKWVGSFTKAFYEAGKVTLGLTGPLTQTENGVTKVTEAGQELMSVLTALASPFTTIYNYFFGTAEASEEAGKSIGTFVEGLFALGVGLGVVWVAWTAMNRLIAATPVTKLMAIGAALLMIGGGILMIGMAVAMIASTGGEGLAALALLSVLVLSLAGAIAVLAAFGPLGVAAALALAVVFVALGAAALMVGAAVWLASNAFVAIAEVASIELAVSLIAIGVAFMALAGSVAIAAMIMVPASIAMAGAMLGLSFAILALYAMVGTVKSISDEFMRLGIGFKLIRDNVLGAANGISMMREHMRGLSVDASDVYNSAIKLSSAVDIIEIALSKSLDTVNVAIVRQLDEYSTLIDSYADKIVTAANRIHDAYDQKLKPVWDWANDAGIDKTIKGEAIAHVQIMKEDDFGKTLQRRAEQKEAEETNRLLKGIATKIDSITGESATIKRIGSLLETYLPQMTSNNELTVTNLTGWAR